MARPMQTGVTASALSLLMLSACTQTPPPVAVNLCAAEVVHVLPRDARTLQLALPTEGPDNIAVSAPGERWFVLRWPAEGINHLPGYAAGANLTLDLARQPGTHWDDDGQPREAPVFDRPGEYLLIAADDLETELDSTRACTQRLRLVN